ncbi:MAG: nucleoside hydrolase [Kiritimatiellae bacterium]|jgi:purine nucleosidase|nr:nucleoside hydrolase [Kiritimatiellia bacterium]
MDFPKLSDEFMLKRLAIPEGKIDMVFDTDTYNEIDDQFAVVYSLLSTEKLNVKSLYAAPFHNDRSTGPEDGMEKSYEEILRLLDRLNISPDGFVYKGSRSFMKDFTPVESEVVDDIIAKAYEATDDKPLYVVAIGAPTNVSSAILKDPEIIKKIVVVWLGGNALSWPSAHEFNLKQDIYASKTLFDSGVPLILFPCAGVVSQLHTTLPEMKAYVKGQGAIGDYLYEIFEEYVGDGRGKSKVLWDMINIAWLLNPAATSSEIVHAPILTFDMTWSFRNDRHFMRNNSFVKRDVVFGDFFARLEAFAAEETG